MFGKVQEIPQTETTPFYPRSPYGAAKVYGYWICVNYREAYGMLCCNGILFNHESPIRGETFVTRKITRGCGAHQSRYPGRCCTSGNLDSQRDWGHARDYVEAMWLMLQQDEPDDYVIATGRRYTVREFVEMAFQEVGITARMARGGRRRAGCRRAHRRAVRVSVDPRYFRPTEVDMLLGDPTKANEKLGWRARTSVSVMVKEMVADDLNGAEKDEMLRREGFQIFEYYE